jgi:NADH dehydrogenase
MISHCSKKHIVILGAGFGGIACAREILKQLPEGFHVTLVDRNSFHVFTPAIYEIATAYLDREPLSSFDFKELIEGVTFSIKEIFPEIEKQESRIHFVQKEVKDVFIADRKILTADGSAFVYDYLVFALGSETNYFGIPGLKEKATVLKTSYDAVNIRNALCEIFARKEPHQKISIVVGGGGFTGCEFAGELANDINKLCVQHPHWRDRIYITIVEGSDRLLPGAKPWIQEEVRSILTQKGVRIVFGEPIERVEDSAGVLKNGEKIFFDLLLWAAGIKGNSLVEHVEQMTIEKGCRILVNNHLQVTPHKEVFAIGDTMYCIEGGTSRPIPATAQGAMEQGRIVGKNILRHIQKKDLLVYAFRWPIFVVTIGGKNALSEIFNIRLRGVAGWLLHEVAFLHYFMGLFPFSRAFSLWISNMRMFSKND